MIENEKRWSAGESGLFPRLDGRGLTVDFFARAGTARFVFFTKNDHPDGGDKDEQAGDFKGRDVAGLKRVDMRCEKEIKLTNFADVVLSLLRLDFFGS